MKTKKRESHTGRKKLWAWKWEALSSQPKGVLDLATRILDWNVWTSSVAAAVCCDAFKLALGVELSHNDPNSLGTTWEVMSLKMWPLNRRGDKSAVRSHEHEKNFYLSFWKRFKHLKLDTVEEQAPFKKCTEVKFFFLHSSFIKGCIFCPF